jgi:hypothetical protein
MSTTYPQFAFPASLSSGEVRGRETDFDSEFPPAKKVASGRGEETQALYTFQIPPTPVTNKAEAIRQEMLLGSEESRNSPINDVLKKPALVTRILGFLGNRDVEQAAQVFHAFQNGSHSENPAAMTGVEDMLL